MNTHISVPIPTEQFLELVDFLREEGSNRDPVDAITAAIDYWIQNASWKQEDLMPEIFESEGHGYTWRYKEASLFLPHGSQIRMKYKDRTYYAKVEQDEILYEGKSISPGTLANTITRSSRNAWRDLWIRRPGDETWHLADDLRRQQQSSGATP